ERANKERERAEANFDLADDAIKKSHEDMARFLQGQPHMKELGLTFYKNALNFYQQFAEKNRTNPVARKGVANAFFQIGIIQHELGKHPEAIKAHRAAGERFEELAKEQPQERFYRLKLGNVLNHMALSLEKVGQSQEAEKAFRRVIVLMQTLVAEDPTHAEAQSLLGGALHNLAMLLKTRGEVQQPYELLGKA